MLPTIAAWIRNDCAPTISIEEAVHGAGQHNERVAMDWCLQLWPRPAGL
jgi:hypothetical protein